jgi:hypothetical protein
LETGLESEERKSTAKALGLAIERKEEHERQIAETHRREAEKSSRTDSERNKPLPLASDSVEVVTH